MAKLGDICTINMGQSPESSSYNTIGEGLPFFQGNADFGDIHPTIRTWCSNPIKIAKKGDLLISVRAPIGALNIANNQCCIGRGLAALTNYTKNIYKDYLWFALLSKINELNSKGTGSTFKAINKKILAETDISLPSLEKQKQIAKQLSCLDTLLLKRKQQLSKLDQLVKSRFIEMFGDPLSNVKNWSIMTLSQVCHNIYGGGTPSKRHPEYFTGTIPWVSPKDMKTNIINDSIDHITNEAIINSTTNIIPIKSILMVIRSGILKHTLPVAINNIPVTINQDMKAFVPNNIIIKSEFLMHYFKSIEFDILSGVRGVTADNIDFKEFQKRKIIVPPLQLQEQFASFVQQVDKVKSSVKQSLAALETLKKSMIQEYFW